MKNKTNITMLTAKHYDTILSMYKDGFIPAEDLSNEDVYPDTDGVEFEGTYLIIDNGMSTEHLFIYVADDNWAEIEVIGDELNFVEVVE